MVTVTWPLCVPEAVGENVTGTEIVAPLAKLAGNVGDDVPTANGPDVAMLCTVNALFAVTVNVCGLLV